MEEKEKQDWEKRPVYLSVKEIAKGYYEEKKSEFYSFLVPVSSPEAVESFAAELKKKHWEARHVCYAAILGDRGEWERAADDGEPGGTAGKPILSVLSHAGLTYSALFVVRYFGGTLLGTGGLVRAYGAASQDALSHAVLQKSFPAGEIVCGCEYGDYNRILYACEQMGVKPEKTDFTDKVELQFFIPLPDYEGFKKKLIDLSAGKALVLEKGFSYVTLPFTQAAEK